MSLEQNKTTVRRVPDEIFSRGRLEVAEEVFAADYVEHELPPGYPEGIAALKLYVSGIRTAFPDLQLAVEDMIAEADRVAIRVTARGTHKGEWELLGIPPTGKKVQWTETHFLRIHDGRIIEHWENRDELGLMQQLGALPEPTPSAS